MKKTAIITGICGQDGSYLAEHLLKKNYKVHGLARKNSLADHHPSRLRHIEDAIDVEYGDITDASGVERFIRSIQPDEVYHLASVRPNNHWPMMTTKANILGTVNILEACRLNAPYCKFYNTASAEMFGIETDEDGYQREATRMNPVTPYGCSKLFGYHMVRNYRMSHKIFAVNGIIFDHESPRSNPSSITVQVIRAAKAIKAGKQSNLKLPNVNEYRDWGHTKDYVRAIHLIMHHKEPDDFVLASGDEHTIEDMCRYVFQKLDINYEQYVTPDPPKKSQRIKGDANKAKSVLGWKADYTFESLLDEMVNLVT